MAIKFDFLRKLAPKVAQSALEAAKAEAGTDLAAQAEVDNLEKKEAEGGAVDQTVEAPAEAEGEELVIEAEGLAELLTEMADKIEALEKKEAPATKEVDLAPIEDALKTVDENFAVVRKEADTRDAEIAALKEALTNLGTVVSTLVGAAPRSAKKEFIAQYRASEAPDTAATKEEVTQHSVTKDGDSFDWMATILRS